MGEMEQKLEFLTNEFIKDRVVFLESEFDEFSCNELKKKILYLIKTDAKKPITIYINSIGGNVDDLLMLYGIMSRAQCKFITIVTGYAYSCGAMLLLMGDERFAYPYSRIMLHQIAAGLSYSKLHDMDSNITEIKRVEDIFNKLIKERTKIKKPEEELKTDRFYSIDDAIRLGILTGKI
jgi:ATP-dependent Clp protease protease subunit